MILAVVVVGLFSGCDKCVFITIIDRIQKYALGRLRFHLNQVTSGLTLGLLNYKGGGSLLTDHGILPW